MRLATTLGLGHFDCGMCVRECEGERSLGSRSNAQPWGSVSEARPPRCAPYYLVGAMSGGDPPRPKYRVTHELRRLNSQSTPPAAYSASSDAGVHGSPGTSDAGGHLHSSPPRDNRERSGEGGPQTLNPRAVRCSLSQGSSRLRIREHTSRSQSVQDLRLWPTAKSRP